MSEEAVASLEYGVSGVTSWVTSSYLTLVGDRFGHFM